MSRRTGFRPEAEEEISEAAAWYEARASGLSAEFLRALDATVALIEGDPFLHPRVHGQMRRALLRRFPYSLLYSCSEAEIVILACVHWRQNPRRWRSRR